MHIKKNFVRYAKRIFTREYALVIVPIILCGILLALFFINQKTGNMSCVTERERRVVRGESLSGVIEAGDSVLILRDYYDCNEVQRDDVVAYSYGGRQDPLIKLVKAIPGDSFSLIPVSGVWNISVNGIVLMDVAGTSYLVIPPRYPRFHAYESDYGAALPANTYMLLGSNASNDSLDSRVFGLVDKSDIIGKVIKL